MPGALPDDLTLNSRGWERPESQQQDRRVNNNLWSSVPPFKMLMKFIGTWERLITY